ncbi:MAG: hypothetical protein MZU97_18190 [Bacillus subtilis]|nr:hypothetical protein [Bacillus subtilis]
MQRSLVDRTIGSSSQITDQALEDDGYYVTDYEAKIASKSRPMAEVDLTLSVATISHGRHPWCVDDQPRNRPLLRGFDFESRGRHLRLFRRQTGRSGRLPASTTTKPPSAFSCSKTLGANARRYRRSADPARSVNIAVEDRRHLRFQRPGRSIRHGRSTTLDAVQTLLERRRRRPSTIEMQILGRLRSRRP